MNGNSKSISTFVTVESFLRGLDQIPWLKNLGKPSARDDTVLRMYAWRLWPGPETPGSELQAAYYMYWHNDLFETDESPLTLQDELWHTIRQRVESLARLNVPYRDAEDAWYGPNAAVWSASWIAALVGCSIRKNGTASVFLERHTLLATEWTWFLEGHWPCTYFSPWGYTDRESAERTGDPPLLVVY